MLALHGIAGEPMIQSAVYWSVHAGYQAIEALLGQADVPDAVFAARDYLALGAIYASRGSPL